ncbi:hypothetical protein [Leeia oryzae]|uniref:hypothetical protein n=1 Tax=Leeia oryzae TaxID=356662 RepID=UPI00036DD9B4|nr:hypothetical protein [Leeia oryzae]
MGKLTVTSLGRPIYLKVNAENLSDQLEGQVKISPSCTLLQVADNLLEARASIRLEGYKSLVDDGKFSPNFFIFCELYQQFKTDRALLKEELQQQYLISACKVPVFAMCVQKAYELASLLGIHGINITPIPPRE